MKKTNHEHYDFGSLDLIYFALKKWKILTSVSVLAIVVSIIVSFQIPERFKSSVILFPTSSISVAKSLISYASLEKGDILSFGEEEESERLLQILNSEAVRSKVINNFDLMNHYQIKPDSKFKLTQLYKKFINNVSSRRTEFMSIEIAVLDESPDTAALIANYMADLIDTTISNMRKERAREAFRLVKGEYLSLQEEINTMEDSFRIISKKGVIDYESQAEVFNEAYANAIVAGNTKGAQTLFQKIKTLQNYGGAYVSLRDRLEFQQEQLTRLRTKYSEARVMLDQNLTNTFIIDRAYPAEKKAVPKKSIIVILSTISAFVFAFLLLLIVESLKKKEANA